MTPQPSSFETRKLGIDGVETVVKVIGDGPAVVSLHGAATLEGFDFARGLADRFRVYLPYHPGFGESGPAPHIAGMQDIVVHNLNLIDALGLKKPHLMGHSMGGWMAAEMAVLAGDKFDKLVLNAPAGLNHPDFPPVNLADIAPQDLPAILAHNVDVALRFFPGGVDCPPPEQFGADREREGAALGNILNVHGMGHPKLGRWIKRIQNETLVVWGEQDAMFPMGQAQIWADSIPNARVLLVPDAGHLMLQEQPGCVTRIGDFLAG